MIKSRNSKVKEFKGYYIYMKIKTIFKWITNKCNRKWIMLSILSFTLIIGIIVKNENYIDHSTLKSTLEEINSMCNSTLSDISKNEELYLKLLEEEDDPLKRGMYSSALILIYTVKGEYDKVTEYGENAVANYLEVKNGKYYAIAEYKYLAWSMLRGGRFSDSFKISSQLLKMVEESEVGLLNNEEMMEIEALVYSIFISIYTEVDLPNKAKIYFDKLCEIKLSDEAKLSVGDRVAYSKILYADSIKDYTLVKKYSEECYEVLKNKDKIKGLDTKDGVLINIALGNIFLGNLEEGFNQIKEAEIYYNKVGDKSSIGVVYAAYAAYYSKIGSIEEALDYYNKTIAVFLETKDEYRTEDALREIINFMEENNISDNIDKYYMLYHEMKNSIKEDKDLNKLLVETINLNNELNNTLVKHMEKEGVEYTFKNLILIIMSILLVIIIKQIYILLVEKEENNKKLKKVASHDYLTGANTRRYGFQIIDNLIVEGKKFSLGILDIDDFKNINDKYGHIFGDYILKNVVKELKNNLDEDSIIIRMGGEEFLIVFINIEKNEAKIKLTEVKSKISKIKFEEELVVRFSGGICDYNGGNIEETIDKIDKLLYIAKNSGKNRIEV